MDLRGVDIDFSPCLCHLSTLRSRLNEGAMKILQGTCRAALFAVALFGATGIANAQTQGTIKIGVLHSLSGTMAISETTLKDTILMMVDDINKKGGLLGKKLEAVVGDPAPNLPPLAEKGGGPPAPEKGGAGFGGW